MRLAEATKQRVPGSSKAAEEKTHAPEILFSLPVQGVYSCSCIRVAGTGGRGGGGGNSGAAVL